MRGSQGLRSRVGFSLLRIDEATNAFRECALYPSRRFLRGGDEGAADARCTVGRCSTVTRRQVWEIIITVLSAQVSLELPMTMAQFPGWGNPRSHIREATIKRTLERKVPV